MKDSTRKFIVSLKRRPQNIALVLLVLCCIIYTFNLTAHSNAVMYVNSRIVALYVFIITLASMLLIFSFLNAYSGKSKKWFMRAIVYALIAVQLGFGALYYQALSYEVFVRDNPVPITHDIAGSMNGTVLHMAALGFSLLAIILMPVYHKQLLKIDTYIEDEEDVSYDGEELELEENL